MIIVGVKKLSSFLTQFIFSGLGNLFSIQSALFSSFYFFTVNLGDLNFTNVFPMSEVLVLINRKKTFLMVKTKTSNKRVHIIKNKELQYIYTKSVQKRRKDNIENRCFRLEGFEGICYMNSFEHSRAKLRIYTWLPKSVHDTPTSFQFSHGLS